MAAGLVLPFANTDAMNAHLAEIARTVAPGAHAVLRRENDPPDHFLILLILDGAGWQGATALKVPDNISLLHLPPYAPEPCVAKNSPPDCFLNAPHRSKTSGPTCAPTNSPSASSTPTTKSSMPAAPHGTSLPTTPKPSLP